MLKYYILRMKKKYATRLNEERNYEKQERNENILLGKSLTNRDFHLSTGDIETSDREDPLPVEEQYVTC